MLSSTGTRFGVEEVAVGFLNVCNNGDCEEPDCNKVGAEGDAEGAAELPREEDVTISAFTNDIKESACRYFESVISCLIWHCLMHSVVCFSASGSISTIDSSLVAEPLSDVAEEPNHPTVIALKIEVFSILGCAVKSPVSIQ